MNVHQNDLNSNPSSPKNSFGTNMASLARRLGAYFFSFIVLAGIISGGKLLSERDSLQKKANLSFNQMVEEGNLPQVGDYVSVETRFVIAYADSTNTRSVYGTEIEAGKKIYYMVVLDDGTVLSVCTSNLSEIETLNRLEEILLSEESDDSAEYAILHGEIKELKENELLSIYEEALELTGVSGDEYFSTTYLVLDTSAGRYGKYLVYSAITLLVCGVIVFRILRKNRAQRAEESRVPNDLYY